MVIKWLYTSAVLDHKKGLLMVTITHEQSVLFSDLSGKPIITKFDQEDASSRWRREILLRTSETGGSRADQSINQWHG